MWPNPQETFAEETFTEEILNGKLHFCEVSATERFGLDLHKISIYSLIIEPIFTLRSWLET